MATNERTIKAQENRRKAVELRRMGKTYQQIAQLLGMAKSSVHKAVTRALMDVQSEIDSDAKLVLAQEMDRLDNLQYGYWMQAIKGDVPSGGQILKIMERRARLLGLDKPDKTALTNPDGTEARHLDSLSEQELDARIAEL